MENKKYLLKLRVYSEMETHEPIVASVMVEVYETVTTDPGPAVLNSDTFSATPNPELTSAVEFFDLSAYRLVREGYQGRQGEIGSTLEGYLYKVPRLVRGMCLLASDGAREHAEGCGSVDQAAVNSGPIPNTGVRLSTMVQPFSINLKLLTNGSDIDPQLSYTPNYVDANLTCYLDIDVLNGKVMTARNNLNINGDHSNDSQPSKLLQIDLSPLTSLDSLSQEEKGAMGFPSHLSQATHFAWAYPWVHGKGRFAELGGAKDNHIDFLPRQCSNELSRDFLLHGGIVFFRARDYYVDSE